ncbi:hypothetical protein EDB85DRAFT_2181641 [Lactarius pseudohatsudake]|nr:hypothetical protein EDB85DRAFT_2181641 [Lactarius pseudohatsudake]
MGSDDGLPRRTLATYGRSRRRDDEETVPDSEDSSSRAEPRPPEEDDGNLPKRPIKDGGDESEPPRPPRAFYRSRKRALSPPSLSYTSAASTEEVIPDSEENGRGAGSSDDEDSDDRKISASSKSSGLSDWKQKLLDIDTEYDMDDRPSGPHDKPSPVSNPKETSSEDPFGSPLTTHASSQRASHRSRSGELPSSPPHNASSSTNTTPQFVFGTPQAPSPTPPTSDGKPSPIPKTKTKGKAKGKTRPPAEVQEASIDDQLVPSPEVVHQTRRKEKQKKPKAPTKKELLEARRETARMRSDMRVSITTEATRPLKITSLLDRFNKPVHEARALQPHSSVSEIEAWPSSSPSASASTHDHERPEAHHAEPSQQRSKASRRSVSPFHSNGLLAPTASKYKTEADADADEASSSDVEMPNIGTILADRQAREDKRTQQEILQQRKLAVLEQQKKAPANAGDTDDSDDGLEVVPDTMHSVAREEAAARAVAGRTRPSAGRNTQLRFARVAPSPQRPVLLPTESPEKRMAAAARPAFLAPSARDNGTAAGRGKRGGGMTKAELQQVMLQRSEVQNEKMRKEKEEEWVRRGGRVEGVMEDVGDKNLQALIEEALERGGGANTQDGGDDDGDEDEEDGDYVPVERGSESPRPMEAQEEGHDDQKTAADEETAHEGEHRAAEAAVDTDSEMESSAPDDVRLRRPRAARPRRAIIGSDDEGAESGAENAVEEEDVHPPPLSLPDLPSPAFTSPWLSRHTAPDHGDEKENDPDVSGNDTDKENRAVVCRAPPGSAPVQGARVLFDDLLGARATVQPLPLLLGDDDPFTFTPSPAKARDEALRRLSSPTPVRVFGASGKRGLSQMFEEEEAGAPTPEGGNDGATRGDGDPGFVEFKPALGSLSQAFEQTQDIPGSATDAAGGFAALRRGADELSLTFDAQAAALQPALEVDDRLRAEAAAIFEKEQEYVIQAAQPASSRPRRELYITENGFLTQTRPEGSSSPLVYRPSPSQRPYDALLRTHSDGALGTTHSGTATSSPFAARQPLSTLAETSPVSSVGREPLRRLRRAQTSPEAPVTGSTRRYAYPRGQSLSPSPSPSPAKAKGGAGPAAMMMQGRTAFSELMLGAKTAVHREGEKAKAKTRSELWRTRRSSRTKMTCSGLEGCGRKGGDEDDEATNMMWTVRQGPREDAQMDESALAKSKVLEKHLCVSPPPFSRRGVVCSRRAMAGEHAERGPTNVSRRRSTDVVAGKRRTRPPPRWRGGPPGSDASDDDSSDDESARVRQRLAKKRRVEGDTLDALARDPATAPFHATYQWGSFDDSGDGVQEKTQDDRDGDEGTGDGEKGVDDDEDVEMAAPDDAGEEQFICRKRAQATARHCARKGRNITNTTRRTCPGGPRPDEGASALHMRPIPVDADMDVLSLGRIHADEQNDPLFTQRMKRWANDEGAGSRHHRSERETLPGPSRATTYTWHYRCRQVDEQPPAKRGAATATAPVRKTASCAVGRRGPECSLGA